MTGRRRRTASPAPPPGGPHVRTWHDAAREYNWSLFLKGYYRNEPEPKDEFTRFNGLNRQQRRRLESKARKLRARSDRTGS